MVFVSDCAKRAKLNVCKNQFLAEVQRRANVRTLICLQSSRISHNPVNYKQTVLAMHLSVGRTDLDHFLLDD